MWNFNIKIPRKVNEKYFYPSKLDEKYQYTLMDEEVSDVCLDNLINYNCNMPQYCLDVMTMKGFTDYQLSHQLLYLIVAIKVKV